MNIVELQVHAADLRALDAFYEAVLGLSRTLHEPSKSAYQIGRSRLVFMRDASFAGRYHIAFDVPNNQFDQARAWIEARVPLVEANDGATMFHSHTWNADQCYFLDPAGNILEIIARHTARTAAHETFSSASLLAISEVGLACGNVPATTTWFRTMLGLPAYHDQSPTFAPVGDEAGLFIVVQNGREWFPNTGVLATPLPTEIVIAGERAGAFRVPDLPYQVRTVEPT